MWINKLYIENKEMRFQETKSEFIKLVPNVSFLRKQESKKQRTVENRISKK